MTTLELPTVIGIAYHIGFRDEMLVDIVCIAIAESGLDTTARNENGPSADCPGGSIDRGILQWNNCYHANITDECADNPVCAFEQAYEHVQNGGSLDIWTTYATGVAQENRTIVTQTAQALGYLPDGGSTGDTLVSIEVPQSWVTEVSNKLGIADPTQQPVPPPEQGPRTYEVVSGDNLSAIAEKYTGDPARWQELYAANVAVIGNDPNLIQPGMVLAIPESWP